MTPHNRRLVAIANGQLGALTREQAHAVGFSDEQLRSRVRSGFLTTFGCNTFRIAGAPDSPLARLRALTLDIGGDVVASGSTAAALLGFDGFHVREPFDVTTGRGRHVNRIGHRIHTTTVLPPIDRSTVMGIPTMRGARALIDLARTETAERLTAAMDSGLRDRQFTEDSLHRRIVALRGPGRSGIRRLLAVIAGREATVGAHSWLERRFLRILQAAGLPKPACQRVLSRAGDRLVRVDFVFPGTTVVVEVLGYTYHRTQEHLRRDTERLNALVGDGFRPYQFTYELIVDQPDHVTDTVRTALESSSRFVSAHPADLPG